MPDNESLTGLGRSPSENGKAKSIPFLGAAHEGRKLGVEARGSLEERRVTDAPVDRKLGAGDHHESLLLARSFNAPFRSQAFVAALFLLCDWRVEIVAVEIVGENPSRLATLERHNFGPTRFRNRAMPLTRICCKRPISDKHLCVIVQNATDCSIRLAAYIQRRAGWIKHATCPDKRAEGIERLRACHHRPPA